MQRCKLKLLTDVTEPNVLDVIAIKCFYCFHPCHVESLKHID